ncbi:MAG: hypothetical protein H0W42_10020 [Gemmatimonadaceae bacterium]|nr:hypothetical protein [Gemmatimonadaceae bacterium]
MALPREKFAGCDWTLRAAAHATACSQGEHNKKTIDHSSPRHTTPSDVGRFQQSAAQP